MLIQDILLRDPATHPLVNHGQARITDEAADGKALAELRGELQTFVCEGQFASGMERILRSYLADLNHTRQRAAWVSGFFGSGKSHFLKMLCHLWANTVFPDGATARALTPALPDEIQALLRELDIAGRRSGGLFAAAGTLPAGTTERVRLTILSILFRAAGLPEQYPQACFCLWLEESGWLDAVRQAIEAAGKSWLAELNNLYVSPVIAKALLECDPHFAPNEAEARKTIRTQFAPVGSDLTTSDFIVQCRRVLQRFGRGGKLPCTVLVLDEVQQFMGQSETVSTLVTEAAEAIETQLESQVMLVGAGQLALSNKTRLLEKLIDRFPISVQLSDTDVETVTRKVLLQKQPAHLKAIQDLLDANAGEISRQLQGTSLADRPEDRAIRVDDYPLLPARRRFWEACFRQIDTAGTESQLRSQLRILHDALRKLTDKPLGALVPASELYEALAPGLVTVGVLPRQIADRIIALGQSGDPSARLRRQAAGLVFLIGEIRRPPGSMGDTGVRANKEHIADLLIEDFGADNAMFRERIGTVLEELAERDVLMRVEGEYRIQTEEGRDWEQDFRNREHGFASDLTNIGEQREKLLAAEVDRAVRETRLLQGTVKAPRRMEAFQTPEPPVSNDGSIPVWIRDQFSATDTEVRDAARRLGNESPVLTAFLPRKSPDELRDAIAAFQAAEQTLLTRGIPGTDAGKLARRAMENRRDLARQRRDALIAEIVAAGTVWQGGGNSLLPITFTEKLKAGAEVAMARLFPRFSEADFPAAAWEAVLKRARDGADRPFEPLRFDGAPEQHRVCQQVRAAIGSGKMGTQIRQELSASPFGWPQDAVDAGLIVLHRLQHVSATLNGAPVPPGQLDQNKIAKSHFRVESVVLSLDDKLALRRLYQLVGVACKQNEETLKSGEFLQALRALPEKAGGEPPLPARPSAKEIDKLQHLDTNERLATMSSQAKQLEETINSWKALADFSEKRLPAWRLTERMARHAEDLSESLRHDVKPALNQMEAIRSQRLLLEASDPLTNVQGKLAAALRADLMGSSISNLKQVVDVAFETGFQTLNGNELWQKLNDKQKTQILAEVGLSRPEPPPVGTDEALVAALDAQSLRARRDEAFAVSQRVHAALRRAAEVLEPRTQFVSLERTTLKTEADVIAWAGRQQQKLLSAIEEGPVQIQ